MKFAHADKKKFYYQMLLIRRFEETVGRMYELGKLAGSCHLYIGQEAVAVGAINCLRSDDYILSNHRGHGHFIVKGADIKLMMAELFGKATGYCKGKGGSMHIADIDLGHLGANGIVGGGLTLAAGAGLGIVQKGTDQVVQCFFGDGAINQGGFHEAMNIASLWKLPVIYICENNQYAMSISYKRSSAQQDIVARGAAYAVPAESVDGMDPLAVAEAVSRAVERARAGQGPTLIEAVTYRFLGHSRSDPSPYRSREEEQAWKERDPLKVFAAKWMEEGVFTQHELDEMEAQIEANLDAAVEFADNSPYPGLDSLAEDVYVGRG